MKSGNSFYVILGRVIILAAIFILWLIIKPYHKTALNILTHQSVDSIQIALDEKRVSIIDNDNLIYFWKQFQKLKPVEPDRIKINTRVIYLYAFIKQKKIPLRIIYGYYSGVIIEVDNRYYKNDSLNILSLRQFSKSVYH